MIHVLNWPKGPQWEAIFEVSDSLGKTTAIFLFSFFSVLNLGHSKGFTWQVHGTKLASLDQNCCTAVSSRTCSQKCGLLCTAAALAQCLSAALGWAFLGCLCWHLLVGGGQGEDLETTSLYSHSVLYPLLGRPPLLPHPPGLQACRSLSGLPLVMKLLPCLCRPRSPLTGVLSQDENGAEAPCGLTVSFVLASCIHLLS